MKNQKLVIFEYLGFGLLPILYWYLKKGYKIKYFDSNPEIEKINWLKKELLKHHIDKIKGNDFDLNLYYLSHDLALDNIEQIYNKWFLKSKLIHQIVTLLDSEITHNVYKKDLLERLQIFYHINLCLNYIADDTIDEITFVPLVYTQFEKFTRIKLNSRVHISFWSRVFAQLNESFMRLFYTLVLCVLPFFIIFWKTRKIVLNNIDVKKYQVGLRIYNTDWGFHYKHRQIDYLLDGKKLNKFNTLFCAETKLSDKYMEQLKERGYDVVEINKILRDLDFNFIKNTIIKKIIPYSFKSSCLSTFSPSYAIETTIGILFKYMTWTRFVEKYNLNHYVVYNDFHKYHIVRNIILSKSGVGTWYYLHSIHYGDLFGYPHEKPTMHHVYFSFLFYDNLVSWGKIVDRIFSRGLNIILKYQNVGCIWSEHIRMLYDEESTSSIKKLELYGGKFKPTKIISIFDTTFGEDVILQSKDIVLFIQGIIDILEKYQDIGVIFKEKRVWEEVISKNSEISNAYNKLRSHKRCYPAGGLTDVNQVIDISNLVISACFTSTTPEALGARKKAIFFDATSRFKGLYYDAFPKMVAHGFDELDNFVNYWLYEVNDAQFEEYLDNYIKGELDWHADGKAITRFRELLSKEKI